MYKTLKYHIAVSYHQQQVLQSYRKQYKECLWEILQHFYYHQSMRYHPHTISDIICKESKWELYRLAKKQYEQYQKHQQLKLRNVCIWNVANVTLETQRITLGFGKDFSVAQETFVILCEKEEWQKTNDLQLYRIDLVWDDHYWFVNLLFHS